jgi:hypothetical protein
MVAYYDRGRGQGLVVPRVELGCMAEELGSLAPSSAEAVSKR